ncbi:class I SAM-dependent methyltransferase [Rhodocytophaga aerolata]|uniref:Class I SAM-dependent methyltransferase n=1 Tax=Rhodocytophaga aerolata TaxID=455078 RepID=A0ABT8RFX1_9BACT|nr:class I SAM-dependent methyltransferase [Rhodocytophaga aerolata]MDO1451007.1 class I SAM-dependent methyltransferase [Rhodocytophaga aerolata]
MIKLRTIDNIISKSNCVLNTFINIPLNFETLDRYYVRSSILQALKENIPTFKGTLLDVGCGQMPYRSLILESKQVEKYIGLDLEVSKIHDTSKADIWWDGKIMPLADASVDCVIATEVFEHCPDLSIVLNEINRVLKPGGMLFFTVPFLWPLHEVPYDEFRYTPFALERLLKNAQFKAIKLTALGGWDASLAQMLGLWVRRRKMSDFKRKVVSRIAKPLIKYLINKDVKPVKFQESTMITGIQGVAVK